MKGVWYMIKKLFLISLFAVEANHAGWDTSFNNNPYLDINQRLSAICVVGNTVFIAVNDVYSAYIYKYSSGNWVYVTNSSVAGEIRAISGAAGGTGTTIGFRLFVGGEFDHVGDSPSVTANNVAVLSSPSSPSQAWSAMSSGSVNGTDGPVNSLVAMPYWISSHDTVMVYAGGSFTSAGNVSSTGIARWSGFGYGGSGWESVGSGVDSGYPSVMGVSVDYSFNPYTSSTSIDAVYLAGGFTKTIGGIVNWNAAKFTGTTWNNLGRAFGGTYTYEFPDCGPYWDYYDFVTYDVISSAGTAYFIGFFNGIEDKNGGFSSGTHYFPVPSEEEPCGVAGYNFIGSAKLSTGNLLSSSSGLKLIGTPKCLSVSGTTFFVGGDFLDGSNNAFYAAKLVSGVWTPITSTGTGALGSQPFKMAATSSSVYFLTESQVFKYNTPF
jgi:hypothetical protein